MIRNLIISIWIIFLTLASAYFGTEMQAGHAGPETAPDAKAPVLIALKSMTVPVIADGAIQGYVLAQISVSAKPDLLKALPNPADLVLADEVFRTIYAEEQVDFRHINKQNLSAMSKKILENINNRAGAALAGEVFIQELHYLSKQEAGAGSLYRR
ncbi:MAG: hypothetical protein ACLPWS_22070 [Rhodomicrobium sp.]